MKKSLAYYIGILFSIILIIIGGVSIDLEAIVTGIFLSTIGVTLFIVVLVMGIFHWASELN